MINMNNDIENPNNSQYHKKEYKRTLRSPLLTHVNEKKETSMLKLEYNMTNNQICDKTTTKHQMKKALVGRGANRGIARTEDSQPWNSKINDERSVKVISLGERTVNDVPIKAVCAVSSSLDGSVLCIYHKFATGKIQPTTIHSKVQLQDYSKNVDDTFLMVGRGQTNTTADGSISPLTMKNGLCFLEQRKPTAWEMQELPKEVMTSIEFIGSVKIGKGWHW